MEPIELIKSAGCPMSTQGKKIQRQSRHKRRIELFEFFAYRNSDSSTF